MAECEHIASGQFPAPGVPGATFVPGVEEIPEGYEVSWENNRNLPNPDPVRLLHGKSAYQLAVEAGYEGTEVEFAAEMAAAAVAKAKAEAAAEAAGKSETNAAGSASAAAQSEQNAGASKEAAKQAAEEADQLAQAAAGSAGAASLSERNAAASEQAAEDAAEEAGKEATAAGNAAGAAARSETNAKTSEENAARSEEEAKKAAQEAQGVILSGPAQPGQLLLVESVSEDGKLLKCTAVDPTHYVETTTFQPTFDGNLEGREDVYSFEEGYLVKVSDRILTVDECIGATMTSVVGSTEVYSEVETVVTSDHITDMSGEGVPAVMVRTVHGAVISLYGDVTAIFDEAAPTGTYFICAPGQMYVKSLSCLVGTKEVIHKLDPKFLPEGVPYTETVLADPTFDGNLEGREYVDTGDGMFLVKMSDQMLTAEDLVGATVTGVMDGEALEEIITQDTVQDNTADGVPLVMALYGGDVPLVLCVNGDVSGAIPLPLSTGVWFVCAPGAFWASSLSCLQSIEKKTYHKLNNGCLDLEWLPTKTNQDVELVPEFTHVSEGTVTRPDWLKGSAAIEPYDTLVVVIDGVRYKCKLRIIPYDPVELLGGYWVAASPGIDKLNNPDYPFVLFGFTESESSPHFYVKEPGEYQVAIYGITRIPEKLPNEFLDLEWLPTKELVNTEISEFLAETSLVFGESTPPTVDTTPLEAWKTYNVYWNGKKYTVAAKATDYSGQVLVEIGNNTLFGAGYPGTPSNTGEPFYAYSVYNSDGTALFERICFVNDGNASETVTVRVIEVETTEEYNRMPKEFMPESVDYIILNSSTEGSTKKFKLTIDDSGTPSYTEVTT